MTPEELRSQVGDKPYNHDTNHPLEIYRFMQLISERMPGACGCYAYQVVQDMTDDELMARWARYKLEETE